ncbi:ribonuclease bn [Planomonospora sphaerica]|uniref:Ribonuclease bn n=1 Tax=Planomonospora sphaerica TaxID=161355 RepID=A0A171BZE0_9ACTN|nr:YihY/virulence factor BrkB family protein [Planomonospora sphaerica]GAT65839.1 ribonuclease bn [Planomonospora sphaerica]
MSAARAAGAPGKAGSGAPETPAQLPPRAWWGVLKRTVGEFRRDNVADWAAALTYYAVLSVFPALIVLVSLSGLVGQDVISTILSQVAAIAPQDVTNLVEQQVGNLRRSGGTGLVAIFGLLVALWSASGYIAAFVRAGNAIYDIEEGRPFWKLTPLRVGLTLVFVVLMAASAVIVTFTGELARVAGEALGFGETAVTVWNYAKWPVLLLIASALVMLLYWAAPNVRQPGFPWISPGGVLAVLLWIVVSLGFAVYVANFGSYNKTYGTLGAVVVFLVWLWLSNMAILLGAEFDAELMRAKKIAAGHPPTAEPYAEPRDPAEEDPDRPEDDGVSRLG